MHFSLNQTPTIMLKVSPLILSLFCAGFLHAQTPQKSPQESKPPLPNNTPTAGTSTQEQAIANPIIPSAKISVTHPIGPLSTILNQYRHLTDTKIIIDNELGDPELNVNAGPGKLLTKEEAISFIEASLLLNGYVFIPTNDPTTLKLVSVNTNKNPRSEEVPVIVRAGDLPEKDQVVHYVMKFDFISPVEAMQIFTQSIVLHAYGAISPIENAASLIITENTALIRSMIAIKNQIDVPTTHTSSKFVQLERADAEAVAQLVSEIYKSQNSTSANTRNTRNSPTRGRVNTRNNALNNALNGSSANSSANDVQIIPDGRTNRILVIASPSQIPYIEKLIEDFDAPAANKTFLKRKLVYLSVIDFLPIAENALTRGLDQGGNSASASGINQNRRNNNRNNNQRFGNQGNVNRNSGSNLGGSRNRSNGSNLGDAEDLRPEAPESIVVGKTLLIADNQTNSVIVSGPPESLTTIEQVIRELDVRPQQIYIASVIAQLTLDDTMEHGVHWLKRFSDRMLERGNGLGGQLNAISNGTSFDNSLVEAIDALNVAEEFPGLSGLTVLGRINENLDVVVNAFQGLSNFNVLNRPTVFTSNNKQSKISSGQRVAVPSSTLSSISTGTTNSVTSNIEYRDVVLELAVLPLINSDDEVTLNIELLNDNIIGTQTVAGNEVPLISTQEMNTSVTVPNRSTIVLGGLITEEDQDDYSGIPVLSKIPVVRHLFSQTTKRKTRRELLIFIQPQIVSNSQDFLEANQNETRRARVSDSALEFSQFPEDHRADENHQNERKKADQNIGNRSPKAKAWLKRNRAGSRL